MRLYCPDKLQMEMTVYLLCPQMGVESNQKKLKIPVKTTKKNGVQWAPSGLVWCIQRGAKHCPSHQLSKSKENLTVHIWHMELGCCWIYFPK